MLKNGYNLGGEQSGHVICLDYNPTGDGILTSLMIIRAILEQGKKASEVASIMKAYPQVLINAKVDSNKKYDYEKNSEIKSAIEKLNKEYLEDIKQELNQTDLLFRKDGEIINLSKLMVNNTNDVASVVLEIQYLSFQVEYKNNDVYSIRRSVYVGIPVSFDLYLNINNSLYDANGNLTDINWQNN